MEGYSIVMDKSLVNTDLLLQEEPSLPEAMRQLNLCDAFVGLLGGRCVAVCLLAKTQSRHNVTNLAVDPLQQNGEAMYDLLYYALDFVRVQGGRFVEIGAANGDLERHETLMRLGFRVVGVWPDYFPPAQRETPKGNNVLNRDMIRYRVDLQELVPGES